MATIKVLYFASIREEVGKREETLTLETHQVDDVDGEETMKRSLTLADVRRRLIELYPDASDELQEITLARNLEYADDATPVVDGDEVALIPPISGG